MILCPNCRHKEMVGALFCTQCGAQLVFSDENAPNTAIYSFTTHGPLPATRSPIPPPFPKSATDALISLIILDTGEVVPVGHREEISLGRVSPGQPIVPDVDLTPYKAYETGVSRLHASLRLDKQNVTLVDLGSANGTRVNGKKISSHTPTILHHGDVLTLGKLKIQILIREK